MLLLVSAVLNKISLFLHQIPCKWPQSPAPSNSVRHDVFADSLDFYCNLLFLPQTASFSDSRILPSFSARLL